MFGTGRMEHMKIEKKKDDLVLQGVQQIDKVAIFVVDLDGSILSWNNGAAQISGYSKEDVKNKNISDFFPKDSREHYKELFQKALKEGSSEDYLWIIRRDQSKIYVKGTVQALYGKDKEPIGFFKVTKDITPIKLEQERLAESNLKKDEFLAILAHEIRTPLNAILGYTEMLLLGFGGSLNDKQEKYMKNVDSSSRFLLEIVNDILDLASISAGKIKLELSEFNINGVLDEIQQIIENQAKEKNLKINFQSDIECIVADKIKIKQILMNLIGNAIKFNKENGFIDLTTYYAENKKYIVFKVSDGGIGIPKDYQKAIFKDFYQIDPNIQKTKGTGLGLALTKKLVELHKGEIWISSSPGEGSTFWFTIPTINTNRPQ